MTSQEDRKRNRDNKDRQEQARVEQKRIFEAYYRVFNTTDGQRVLSDMKQQFSAPLLAKTSHDMVVAAALHAVLNYVDNALILGAPMPIKEVSNDE